MRIELPRKFWKDHSSRDLPSGELLEVRKNTVVIEATLEELREILDDAKFYSDSEYIISEMGRSYIGLVSSAKATVKAIQKVVA